jgi:hypothetical protein
MLQKALSCQDEDLITLAIQGACKLLLLTEFQDKSILCHLFLVYYSTLKSEKMKECRQILAFFFDIFALTDSTKQELVSQVSLFFASTKCFCNFVIPFYIGLYGYPKTTITRKKTKFRNNFAFEPNYSSLY